LQSFLPFIATPKHLSLAASSAIAGALMANVDALNTKAKLAALNCVVKVVLLMMISLKGKKPVGGLVIVVETTKFNRLLRFLFL
jgi:hypothetical protein